MPPDIILTLKADDLTADAFEEIKRELLELGRLEERVNDQANQAEIARRRHLEANARAREAAQKAEAAGWRAIQEEIKETNRVDTNRSRRLQANARARQARSRAEQAEWDALRADINEAGRADNNFTRRHLANQRTRQREISKSTAAINLQGKQISANATAARTSAQRFVSAERTKQLEISKTTKELDTQARLQLETSRERNREAAREHRTQERIARENFVRQTGGGSSFFGAGAGAGLIGAFQRVAGQLALFSGGIYAFHQAFTSIVRDRARVQRLETGIRDLTDDLRQQAIIPRLQEIALLPGLDYVTATQAFTRAISGGFTDQQSLRLINQIRNAVALSQGSIEDTNEVLRQFIQIQARGRFDQENLRPILERAPFIRRVIQEEFGTQIGGDIQQVLESRGQTATEGILAIAERLAQGPIADPTTLQNALDNVRNELILFRNELGRQLEPALRDAINTFTEVLRFGQTPAGQVTSSAIGGGLLLGGIGLIGDIISRRRPTDYLSQTGYNRLAGQSGGRRQRQIDLAVASTQLLYGIKTARDSGITRGLRVEGITSNSRFIQRFLDDPEFASRQISNTQDRLTDADQRYRDSFQRGRPTITRQQSFQLAGLTARDNFIRDALLLNAAGQPSRGRRFLSSIIGRPGERHFFGIRGLRSPFVNADDRRYQAAEDRAGRSASRASDPGARGVRGAVRGVGGRLGGLFRGLRSPFVTGGLAVAGGAASAFLSPLALLGVGAALFGGVSLARSAYERAGRNEQPTLLSQTILSGAEGAGDIIARVTDNQEQLRVSTGRLTGQFNQLSDRVRNLFTGGIENFDALISQLSTSTSGIRTQFEDAGLRVLQRDGTLTRTQAQLVAGNPVLESLIREVGDPNISANFERSDVRQRVISSFGSLQETQAVIEQATEQAATERSNIIGNIRRLEQSRLEIERPPIFYGRSGELIFYDDERERYDRLQEINKALTEQEANLQKINDQEEILVGITQRLRDQYDEVGRESAIRLLRVEDFIGKIQSVSPRELNLGQIFSEEDLARLNTALRISGQVDTNFRRISATFQEVANVGRLAFRELRTGLGDVNVLTGPTAGTRAPAIDQLIGGIIPPGGRNLPQGAEFTPGSPIDVTDTGRREVVSTRSNLLDRLGVSANTARQAINGAIESYRTIRAEVEGGAPPDPNNPTGILPIPILSGRTGFNTPGRPSTGIRDVPSIPIIPQPLPVTDQLPDTRTADDINANRQALQRLGEAWQEVLGVSEDFNRQRGLLDFTRPARIREIGLLIAQLDNLRQQFESLRPAVQASINALPENNPLRQELERLIDVPLDDLTRRIMQLREEITNLSSSGLLLRNLRDSLNRISASVLGGRNEDTGIRAFGRQFGDLLGTTIDAPRGREIFRQRQLSRSQAFSDYFAGSAESLYDQFLAPSILDAVGIGSGQSRAQERSLERLSEDVERQREAVRNNDRLNARQQAEQLLEIDREYQEEKRALERQYEEERSDAWANWVRQQLTDFPKLIFQQLNLQLAARATNFILNSLGLGSNIPITGPGIGGGGGLGSLFGGGGAGGAGGAGASGASGAGLAASAATAGVVISGALAAHNIGTGIQEGLFDDLGKDFANLPIINSVTSFFEGLHFNNPLNDQLANAAGRMESQRMAYNLGRDSARDIVRNYSDGVREGNQINSSISQQDGNTYTVSGDATINIPFEINNRIVKEISFTMDELAADGRL